MNSPGNMAETKGSVIKARGKITCFKKRPAHFEKQHSSFLLYFVILIKTLEQPSAYKEVGIGNAVHRPFILLTCLRVSHQSDSPSLLHTLGCNFL